MGPNVVIRLSKRFLIVAAILVLVISSSARMAPALAQDEPKIVYVAICSDSEMWGGLGPYVGSTDPHPTMDVREYSVTVPLTVAAVFNSDFRNSHQDSFGNVFKMSWFTEMDYLIAQSNFVWADGSPAGVSGYTAIRDLLLNNWGTQIQTYGDSVEYHHHYMIYDGTWQQYDNGPDAGYPEYQMYALDHMIIDRNFYPSTWRSGWWIMPPALSSWLEQWMPFDYTPQTGIWYPVHPSGMDRWQTKCPYAASDVISDVNDAFAYARDHGSAVYSFCTHDDENMQLQVAWLQYNLNTADANETAYPNVSFKYVTAKEAMQLALGFTDFTPPTFTITPSGGTYTVVSSEPLWKNHPYIALKYTDGTYSHMNATPTGPNTWTVTPPTSVSVVGVAGSDLYGNPGTATLTRFDFGMPESPVEAGYTQVTESTSYSASTGYGWTNTAGLQSRDRGAPDNLRRDLIQSLTEHTFNIDLANGDYKVTVIIGDQHYLHDNIDIYAEDVLKIDDLTATEGTFQEVTFYVTITDGQLNLRISDAGVIAYWVINALTIQPGSPPTPPTQAAFDFGASGSPVESGYTQVTESTLYTATTGYGWTNTAGLQSRDRGAPDNLRRDLIQSLTEHTFNIDLANGDYKVTVIIGDQDYTHDVIDVYAENTLKIDDLTTTAGIFQEVTFYVTIADGQLNLRILDDGGTNPVWVITALTIQPGSPPTPPTQAAFDFGASGSPVESGYTQVTESTLYTATTGYGWTNTAGLQSRDRGAPDNLRRDLIQSLTEHTFNIDLANGDYQITIIIGDQQYTHDNIDVYAENTLKIDDLTPTAGTFQETTFYTTITDGQLNLKILDDGGTIAYWVINALTIQPA